MRSEYLDVKAESLAAEARIIRRKEHKALRRAHYYLHHHEAAPAGDRYTQRLQRTIARLEEARSNNELTVKQLERLRNEAARRLQRLPTPDPKSETGASAMAATDDAFSLVVGLHEHRVRVVRPAARAAHLARMFLRGVPYEKVENNRHKDREVPRWHQVRELVVRYGNGQEPGGLTQRLVKWAPNTTRDIENGLGRVIRWLETGDDRVL